MTARVYEATRRRIFSAPRSLVWALVADTNRWDRAAGLAAVRYTWREIDGRRARVGHARELGIELSWVEPPYEWVESRFVDGKRHFLTGPASGGGFRVRLDDRDGGTEAVAVGYVAGEGALMAVLGRYMRGKLGRALGRYLDAIGELLVDLDLGDAGTDAEPAVARARRLLLGGYDPIVSGTRSAVDHDQLDRRAEALRATPAADLEIANHLVRFVAEAADEDVAQMRPFELARKWERSRRDVLRLFLHATRAGLVDLRWQINCPVCRVSAGVAEGLDTVSRQVHCEACNIDYDVDFGEQVEAVFQCNRALRPVEPAVYCASSPAFRPHVLAQLRVEPGQTRRERADLPPGTLRLRTLETSRASTVELEPRSSVHLDVGDEHVAARPERSADESEGELVLTSMAADEMTVLVERAGWSADAVLGSVIASFPDFIDLFATEAPASGVDLSVGHLAVLFSDLTGSTALYSRVGDARAFALVEEHFRSMRRIIGAHDGAVIKTMGDAVMATFAAPANAARAAIDMVADNAGNEHEMGLKLGVAAGACLAVRANDRLDFFGRTVNLAARLQAQASAGRLVVGEELLAEDDVQAALAAFPQTRFEATLKGIGAGQPLIAVDLRVADDRA